MTLIPNKVILSYWREDFTQEMQFGGGEAIVASGTPPVRQQHLAVSAEVSGHLATVEISHIFPRTTHSVVFQGTQGSRKDDGSSFPVFLVHLDPFREGVLKTGSMVPRTA
jgi:hypothetical protein